MRVVLQRVQRCSVEVDGAEVASIAGGLLILVGAAAGDTPTDAERLARKCAECRVFADANGRFDRSLLDVGGEALVVSQFTLLADVRRGRRPSFTAAASPDLAEPLVEAFASHLRDLGISVSSGVFGASMQVHLVNDGPVTITIDSSTLGEPRRR